MDELIGQKVGQYIIQRRIGTGSMAVVYLAHQPVIERAVAIKFLHGEHTRRKDFIERFHREARAAARLRHIHVLPIYDYGEHNGLPYLVMPYIDTGTLADKLKGEPLPDEDVIRYASQIASALDHAHSQGVIHRDVKPSNVLIDADGNVLLADFSLAKLVGDESHITGAGTLIGTPNYMSPEQCSGLPTDARSDIYSLGVIVYEMLTGHVPFQGETPIATVLMHVEAPIPPVPGRPELDAIIRKALAKSPDDRYQRASELAEDLQRALRQAPKDTPTLSTTLILPQEEGYKDVATLLGRWFEASQGEALQLRHNFIGVEHLFMALLRGRGGTVPAVFQKLGCDPHRLRSDIQTYVGMGVGEPEGALEPTPRLQRVLEIAWEIAARHGAEQPGEPELLLAILYEGRSVPIRVMRGLGVEPGAIKAEMMRVAEWVGPALTGLDSLPTESDAELFPSPGGVGIPGLRFDFMSWVEDGKRVTVGGQQATIGRARQNEVVIKGDSRVSRRHALVRLEGGRLLLSDLGSRNGTFLEDGSRVTQEVDVTPTAMFRLGRTWLKVEMIGG